jgi:hypothetical protein
VSNGNTLQAFLSMFVPTGDGITASPGLITGGNALTVTQTGTPSASILVSPAAWVVPGPAPTSQGSILWTPGTATQTVGPFAAANATNPRIDLLTVHVNSAGDASTAPDVAYAITTGTPAASPSPPSTPAGDVFVRQVLIPANSGGTTTITNANITGTVATATLRGQVSRTRPSSPAAGTPVFENVSGKEQLSWWTGSAWVGPRSGTVTLTTNGSGVFTWNHGFGFTPNGVVFTPTFSGTSFHTAVVTAVSSTSVTGVVWYNGAVLASGSGTFRYSVLP